MSGLVKLSELKLQKLSGETSQPVFKASYKNGNFYFKKAPAGLTTDAELIRTINEAIAGCISEIINDALGKKIQTPSYSLVVDDNNKIVGLLSSEIQYFEPIEDFNTEANNFFEHSLKNGGLGVIEALRTFLKDFDSSNNIGQTDTEEYKGYKAGNWASIDPGLSNSQKLRRSQALLSSEERELPENVYDITAENILVGMLRESHNGFHYLPHHAFPKFNTQIACFAGHNVLAIAFFKEVYKTYFKIAETLTATDFTDKIRQKLFGDTNLNDLQEKIFNTLVNSYLEEAIKLKSTLEILKFSDIEKILKEQNIVNITTSLSHVVSDAFIHCAEESLSQKAALQKTETDYLNPANNHPSPIGFNRLSRKTKRQEEDYIGNTSDENIFETLKDTNPSPTKKSKVATTVITPSYKPRTLDLS